jgi:lysophospholipase L1-like esterase
MLLLGLALAAVAVPCLRVPWWRVPELAAFGLLPLLPVLLGGDTSGYSSAPEFAAGSAGALGVLLLLALVHGRGARAALLVLAGAVVVPLGLSAAAGAPVSRSERAGTAWAWIGVPRLAPGLAHVQHPRLREWNYYLDAHALRGKRFATPKPAGMVRVICLGTSSTWGHGIDETSGLDYPSLLGDALRERMPDVPIEVVNAGVSGASTPRLLTFLREVLLGFEPDIVVFSLSYNDATFLTRFDEQGWIETLSEPGAHVGWLDRLVAAHDLDRGLDEAVRFEAALPHFGGDSLAAWRAAVGDGPTPVDRFERALHDVTDLLQSRGIGVVLVKEAQRGNEPRDWKPELYAAIDRIGESHGARVVDPKPALEAAGGNAVFMDPVHLTPRGNRAQAGAIAPVVQELIAQRRGATTQAGR